MTSDEITRREMLVLAAAGSGALVGGTLIAVITVPANPLARRSHYLKVRDRASFEFAVVSTAVALDMDGPRIREARVALGGVGTKPWPFRKSRQL